MINTIVFDFGNVLYDLDIDGCVNRLTEICGLDRAIFTERFGPIIHRYEQGQVSDENIIWHFQQTNPTISPRLIVEAWNSMLIGIDDSVFPMLEKLGQCYKIYLLSNINGFHARHIDRYLKRVLGQPDFLDRYFDQVFYSHVIQMRKPQERIYQYVTEQTNVREFNEILFIDDNRENVEAARQYGWKASLHSPDLRIADQIQTYIDVANL